MRKSVIGGVVALVALLVAYMAMASSDESTAILTTSSGPHEIAVELAQTPQQRETGLMNRASMPADSGMLFAFDETRDVNMWMKNTLIPLDMLFIDETGKVIHIKTNAQPLSLEVIPSGGPARYVLELNGGASARYGTAVGDTLAHPVIGHAE